MSDKQSEKPHTSGPEDIVPEKATTTAGNKQRDKLGGSDTRAPSESNEYGSAERPDGESYSERDTRDNSPQL